MTRKRLFVTAMILILLIVSTAWVPVATMGSNNDISEFVGPGKHVADLCITSNSNGKKTDGIMIAGTAAMWNTREEFIVKVEPDEEWKISEVRIFVGTDPVPITKGGQPQLGLFPYREHFTKPVSSYELRLDLEDDLGFTWGNKKKGEHVHNVSIYVRLTGQGNNGNGKQVVNEEAWAEGNNEFDGGWWTKYALTNPRTGHFAHTRVAGVTYSTDSQVGLTSGSGAFDYIEGETVRLSLGALHLGEAKATSEVSLFDLVGTGELSDPRVVQLARLLLSLDDDGDPNGGILIAEPVIECLDSAIKDLGIVELGTDITELIEATVLNCVDVGIVLTIVDDEGAYTFLEEELVKTMFRKNVSKTPDLETAKAKLELMPVYVPALRANGEAVELSYTDPDGNVTTRVEAKPLVVVYADEIPDRDGAMDVYGAISRDEGNTWKVTNLSRSADKSSFTLANGYEFPGSVMKPNIKVQDNKILVIWTSRYARSGKPTYSIREDDEYEYDDPYYEPDIWGVSGPQRSTDYTDMGFPEVGELPYHAVWTCRGVISKEDGTITWFKPERLTSGRRDAYQIMVNGAKNAGFALVWQEDPEGVRPGEMAGPGHGWSGATTNHKTDVWYSYIKWDDFDKIDENFVSGGDPQHEDEDLTGRPKVLVPFSLPVRISDNDTLNSDNMKLVTDENGPIQDVNGDWVVDTTADSGVHERDSESGNAENSSDLESDGSHSYGYLVDDLCVDFYEKTNNQGATKWVAITADGRLMDGDTGASRPNIMLQPYKKADDTYSAWAMIVYEETKGVGSGPPEDCGTDEISVLSGDNDGSGEQKGQDTYVPDKGKNVIYHSFDMEDPDLVSGGTILNPQATDEDGNLLFLKDEEGQPILDYRGEEIPAYENTRRPRLIVQSKSNALGAVDSGEDATVMVTVFKMGEDGKGRPSDIFMRRWVVVNDVNDKSYKGNPYRPENLDDECQNISSVTPTESWVNPDSDSEDPYKVTRWKQEEENLDDFSWTNPYDDARAHRGFLKGNFLAIAFDWTPNWAAARNGNDVYNLYIRRSFDGGANWTTDPEGDGVTHYDTFKVYPTDEEVLSSGEEDGSNTKDKIVVETTYAAGAFEPARNLSQLTNTKETVIEPRLVGVPGTISGGYPEDTQSTNAFWITYGTHSNPGRHSEEEGVPLDLYYSYSTDFGESFYTISKTINPDSDGNNAGTEVEVWDWLAKDTGKKVAEQAECQIRMTPDGSVFYAVWNETGENGSDVMFRRIMRDGGSIDYTIIIID